MTSEDHVDDVDDVVDDVVDCVSFLGGGFSYDNVNNARRVNSPDNGMRLRSSVWLFY